jgi:3-oxoacyl-[acyl-carrier protein] reductase
MDLGLKNKSAIVLTASKGFGKAAAESLVKEGCNVAICLRDKQQIPLGSVGIPHYLAGLITLLASEQAG